MLGFAHLSTDLDHDRRVFAQQRRIECRYPFLGALRVVGPSADLLSCVSALAEYVTLITARIHCRLRHGIRRLVLRAETGQFSANTIVISSLGLPPCLDGSGVLRRPNHGLCEQNPEHRRYHPLATRVVGDHNTRRPVNPGQGVCLPHSVGAARARRPSGRGFLWSGVLRAPSGAPFQQTVRQIVARPATSICLADDRTISVGDRR